MRFLSKIRERQFAKKWGSTYNLSRAVLAGVLAAGCLMPGFAEAATPPELYDSSGFNWYPVGNTATITENISGDTRYIYWKPGAGETSVDGCIINVDPITIVPEIYIYGGKGATAANGNSVNISGGTFRNVYGGFATSGTAEGNRVITNGGEFNANVCGGFAANAANGNSFIINPGTFNSLICGGDGLRAANGNIVEIRGGTINADVSGGLSAFGTANKNIVSISGGIFNVNPDVRGGYSKSDTANGNIVSISDGSFISSEIYGGYVKCEYFNTDDKTAIGNQVIISGGSFINSKIYGGCVKFDDSNTANNTANNTADGNSVSISGGTFFGNLDVRGGYSPEGTANENSVSINGGNIRGFVYGGYGSKGASFNSVIISGNGIFNGGVFGGLVESDSGEANNNQVIISGGTITGDVIGGSSPGTANDNKVILVGENATYPLSAEQTLTGSGNIEITGIVFGGYGTSNRSGNQLHVYGSNTKVGHIANFDNLYFYINKEMTYGDVMLTITGDSDTDISTSNVLVNVDGAPQAKGNLNTITLIQKTGDGKIIKPDDEKIKVNFGSTLTGTGSVALDNSDKDLVLTLKNIRVNENGKSLVETRAAAAFVVNNMSDFMLGTGMEQAKAAAGGVTPIDAGTMAPFAAVGGSNMRYTTGSYVDVNGWNGAVGFAKQADKLLFGVAVEHGRGNYDSYLDNGVHASGDIKSTGGVIFGEYKLDNGVHYDAALRAGRVKSDYSSTATSYDESSTYYGFSLGGGKELTVSDKATLDVYGRYYFSHTNGSDVSIATGEEIDFDAVNSHRLRIGGRYTTTLTEKSKAYAGLAWQYEFGGDAKAAINGYSAPTPSLQGHSAIVEAGYKLNAGKNLTLDFNLNGAMGKQRGIGGGIGAQWLF